MATRACKRVRWAGSSTSSTPVTPAETPIRKPRSNGTRSARTKPSCPRVPANASNVRAIAGSSASRSLRLSASCENRVISARRRCRCSWPSMVTREPPYTGPLSRWEPWWKSAERRISSISAKVSTRGNCPRNSVSVRGACWGLFESVVLIVVSLQKFLPTQKGRQGRCKPHPRSSSVTTCSVARA